MMQLSSTGKNLGLQHPDLVCNFKNFCIIFCLDRTVFCTVRVDYFFILFLRQSKPEKYRELLNFEKHTEARRAQDPQLWEYHQKYIVDFILQVHFISELDNLKPFVPTLRTIQKQGERRIHSRVSRFLMKILFLIPVTLR
jgi:hypothetical protein